MRTQVILYIDIYICMYVCMYIYIYIHTYGCITYRYISCWGACCPCRNVEPVLKAEGEGGGVRDSKSDPDFFVSFLFLYG